MPFYKYLKLRKTTTTIVALASCSSSFRRRISRKSLHFCPVSRTCLLSHLSSKSNNKTLILSAFSNVLYLKYILASISVHFRSQFFDLRFNSIQDKCAICSFPILVFLSSYFVSNNLIIRFEFDQASNINIQQGLIFHKIRMSGNTVKLHGANFLRQRLILSTISGKNIKITKIRESEADPGLVEYEMNLLKLLGE